MKSLKIKNQNGNVKSKILSFSSVIFHFDISILHLKGLSFFILIFAFYILALPKQASAAVSNLGLVGYWSFNEGTGSYAGDSSGNNNRGILTNGPTWVDGKRGKALSFDGVNDLVNISNPSSLNVANGSVSFWMKTNGVWGTDGTSGGDVASLIGRHDSSGSCEGINILQTPATGVVTAQNKNVAGTCATVSSIVSTGNLKDNNWHHVVYIFSQASGGTNYLYVDGKVDASGTNSTAWTFDGQNLLFGDSTDTFWEEWQGKMDEVRIYNRALSATENQALYKSGAQKFTAPPTNLGLVGYWSMNENTGTIAGDASGNNNRGILTNGPTWVDGKRGKALNFDGVDDYVNAGSAGNFERTNSFTVSLWIKRNPNPTVTEAVVAKEVGSGTFQGWGLLILGGAANDPYRINIANTSGTNNILVEYPRTNDSGWHHVVFTYNGTSAASGVFLYEDGISKTQTIIADTLSASILTATNRLFV